MRKHNMALFLLCSIFIISSCDADKKPRHPLSLITRPAGPQIPAKDPLKDSKPPTAPKNLDYSGGTLSWDGSSDDSTPSGDIRYNVYIASTNLLNGSALQSAPHKTTVGETQADLKLDNLDLSQFQSGYISVFVTAVDKQGNVSRPSEPILIPLNQILDASDPDPDSNRQPEGGHLPKPPAGFTDDPVEPRGGLTQSPKLSDPLRKDGAKSAAVKAQPIERPRLQKADAFKKTNGADQILPSRTKTQSPKARNSTSVARPQTATQTAKGSTTALIPKASPKGDDARAGQRNISQGSPLQAPPVKRGTNEDFDFVDIGKVAPPIIAEKPDVAKDSGPSSPARGDKKPGLNTPGLDFSVFEGEYILTFNPPLANLTADAADLGPVESYEVNVTKSGENLLLLKINQKSSFVNIDTGEKLKGVSVSSVSSFNIMLREDGSFKTIAKPMVLEGAFIDFGWAEGTFITDTDNLLRTFIMKKKP